MNTQNFTQTGGFPLETDTLGAMQTAYSLFNALGALAGNKSIIKGCVVAGSVTGDGVVYIDGELFEFVGGNTQSTVRIVVEPTSKLFENGETHETHYRRYVTFGSGAGSMPWADFNSIESILSLQGRILPPGTNPQLYSGSIANIPTGWQLCDGTNGTPDLRGKFIVGYNSADADYDAIGSTGGEKEHTLTESEMPSHNHNGSANSSGSHTHTVYIPRDQYNSGNNYALRSSDNNDEGLYPFTTEPSGAHIHSLSIDNKGGGNAHENRPPYYTLAYIIYTGN